MRALIGQSIPRREDLRLVRGAGRYSDDIALPHQAYAAFVRAPHAHARIRSIDVATAVGAPGVLGVFTAADYLADGHGGIEHVPVPADAIVASKPAFQASDTQPIFDHPHLPLVAERVRHVGEAVAMVVANTVLAARDAAERVAIDYEPLPAVVTPIEAISDGAPQLWDGAPQNTCVRQQFGDVDTVEAVLRQAHTVVTQRFVNNRIVNAQMEPRCVLGDYDPTTGIHTLIGGSQGAVRQKAALAGALRVPAETIVVICPDVGGGFGPRTMLYPEAVGVVWAARRLGRPVKWTSDRSEGFLTDYQGRDCVTDASLALAEDGRFLALHIRLCGNIGAHTVSFVPLSNGARIATTVYDIPVASVDARGVMTNTVPTAPYRGAGRPEATFVLERLIDMAAARLGIDRITLRKRNLIRRAQLPYRNAMGLTYDSGDFTGNMRQAMEIAGWSRFAQRRRDSRRRGFLRGIGLANYVESPVGAPREKVAVSVGTDDRITVLTGTQSTGQGHETTFAQVVAARLGVPIEAVQVVSGDTRLIDVGGGTHSDRSMRLAGTLLAQSTDDILVKARALVAERHACTPDAVGVDDGVLRPPMSNEAYSVFDVARLAAQASKPATLRASAEFVGRIPAYPTGCAICEVEVDPDSGVARIVRYTSVDDVGQAINPMIVHGQVHGGIAQGTGQALREAFVVEPHSGQVMTGSFMDYGMPRAHDFPSFEVAMTEDPTSGNPLRVKGGGESGITPATAAILNAIVDALKERGVEHVEMPASPMQIWRALRQGETGRSRR